MKEMKRVLSFVLCFVMLVGMMPAIALSADAAGDTHYLMFATDRHANTSVIGNIINNMEITIGENALEYLALGGDMVGSGNTHPEYNSSEVLAEATNAASSLNAAKVDIVAGIHDMNVNDDAGIVLPYQGGGAQIYEGDDYYVYGVEEYCISDDSKESNWSSEAQKFVDWANGETIDKSKVIFVSSHYPIHAKRDDNDGAYYWHQALNAVATGGDKTVERDIVFFHGHNHTVDTNEYVYNVGDTMSIQNGSSTVSDTIYYTYATAGYLNQNSKATLVTLTDDQIVLTKYSTSGSGTAMTTVKRAVTEVTLSSIAISGTTEYTVGDELDLTVTATYSDGSTADVTADAAITGCDMTAAGTYTVTATYEGLTATIDITVAEEQTVDPTEETTDPTEGGVPDPETATGSGSTTTTEEKTVYVLVDTPTAGNQYIIVSSGFAGTGYALKENTTSGSSITINAATSTITAPYIETSDESIMWNATSGLNFQSENGGYYLNYSNSSSSGKPGGNSSYTVSFSTSSASDWTAGTNQLYRNGNQNDYWLRCNGSTWAMGGSNTTYNVYFYEAQTIEVETTTTVSGTYSIAGNPTEVTKVVTNGSTVKLGSTLTFTPDSGTATTTDTSATATYEIYSDPDGVISGIDGNTVTFSGVYGKALVKVSYTTNFGVVTNYITVTATEPTYVLDITSGGKVVTSTTIAQKGVTASTTLQLGTQITFVSEDGTETLDSLPDGATLTWTIPVEYQNIATVDQNGLVSFKGVDGAFYVMATLTVGDKDYTVGVNISATTSQYSTPTDGTDDFPEYPNEGAIRYDKTATAVGNFSETGIAQVELSMTGVPYTTGSEIDVVVMLDMSTSMDDDRIAATVAATKVFVESIVKNTDGTYNSNRIYVGYFNGDTVYTITGTDNIGGELATVDNDTEYDALIAAIEDEYDGALTASGTNYDVSLEECYNVLTAAKKDGIGNDRDQFVLFMSDGGPTDYATSASNVVTESTVVDWFSVSASDSANWSNTMVEEYWSGLMKDNDVTIYSVGLILNEQPTSGPQDYRSYSAEQNYYVTSTILTGIASGEDYFINCESADDTDEMEGIFSNIAAKILQAATDITVEDQITDEYTMIFDVPTGSVKIDGEDSDLADQEFYIEFGKYALDENHERTTFTSVTKLYLENTNGTLSAKDSTDPVFEQKTIGDKGTLYYWSTNADDGDTGVSVTVDGTTYYFVSYGLEEAGYNMTSGAYAHGTVDSTNMSTDLVIATPYFVYNASTKMIYWTVDKLDTYEYTLSYFLYLNNSATEVATDNERDPGSYPTNDHAYITYTNFNGNDCRQVFPIPQLTWNGAQVSYVFYLVNSAGQPINKSGQVVDFANATFITDVYTKAVVWNKGEDGKVIGDSHLSQEWLAQELLPEEYSVYDEAAEYELMVYADATGAAIFNYFTIAGGSAESISDSLNERLTLGTTSNTVSVETTKVYNTKAGVKYDEYGTYTSKATDSIDNETILSDFDFANTTVAFAVVWQPRLVPDVVVVDYGLDVLINVVQNDILQNKVTGIGTGTDAYGTTAMNTGVSTDSKLGTAALTIDGNTISLENETSVRFHQDDMEFAKEVVFYYETPVEFWEGSDPTEGYMYSSVTVIPATTIYYEDNFVTYESYTWDTTEEKWGEYVPKDVNGDGVTDMSLWSVDGTAGSATQAQDRPGESLISGAIDADNIYGYDGAYASMNLHSNGSAMKATVDYDNYASASFSFWGTGFDVVSMTTVDTGTLAVNVTTKQAVTIDGKEYAAGALVKSMIVDTYYGYKQDAEGNWVVDPNNKACLYQVPVMEVEDLPYGQYQVEIQAMYEPIFDNIEGSDSYELYLDAIRIYDPANDGAGNTTIEDAYVADHEGWPSYIELRNSLIDAETLGYADTTTKIEGMVFIDGDSEVGDAQLSDYVGYGPNNEVYLDAGQSVAFQVEAPANLDRIHIGIKSANGSDVSYTIKNVADGGTVTNQKTFTLNTSTDMYYDMTEWKDGIVVITNSGASGILSITNIKSTYKEDPAANGDVDAQNVRETRIYMTAEAANVVVNAMKPAPVNPFADVQKEHFFYDAVLWAVENGITNGVNADHFGPYLYCNRAQVVTFLWRAAGSPEPVSRVNPFADVPEDSWYTDAVLWAVENGITNGLSADTFGPDVLCNRAQVVTFLWRANGSKVASDAANPFADVPADAFYHDAVVWALKNGITTGATPTEFNPSGSCMRAHVVTFLYRAEQLPEYEVAGWASES